MRFTGTVASFHPRGFGFILPDRERTAIFTHVSNIRNNAMLRAGERVDFIIIDTKKGQRAVDVQLLDACEEGAL
jgi:CspA family cold shock protein